MQHVHKRQSWVLARRFRMVASASGSVLVTALWAAPAVAQPGTQPDPAQQPMQQQQQQQQPPPPPQPQVQTTTPPPTYAAPPMAHDKRDEEPDRFDSGFNFYISPGGINHPYAGRDSINYGDTYDPGYQWGLGFGYFARSNSRFAVQIGAFFEHAMLNAENRGLWDDDGENILRAGLELEPGIVLGERLFLSIPLRGGYAASVVERDEEIDAEHGPMFGVALGMDVALWRGFYVGTAVGTDLQFFRSGDDFDTYVFSWRTRLGYRF